jgi:hypothetical protein
MLNCKMINSEEASLAEIIEKMSQLKTKSKAFITRKLLNSPRTEVLHTYLEQLYEPSEIMKTLNSIYPNSSNSNSNALLPNASDQQQVAQIARNNVQKEPSEPKTPIKKEKYSKELKEEAVKLANCSNSNLNQKNLLKLIMNRNVI